MKRLKKFSILIFLFAFTVSCQKSERSNLTLLNAQIPAGTALIFGQDIISTDNFEFAITFNPEMDELYFTRKRPEEDNGDIYWIDFRPIRKTIGKNFNSN